MLCLARYAYAIKFTFFRFEIVRIIGTIKQIKNQYTTKPLSTFKEMAILANTEWWNR